MAALSRLSLCTSAFVACVLVFASLAGTASAQPSNSEKAASAAADATKIISIGGDITEILYAIGADKSIVAIDSTSQYPPEALQQKKDVGYMRALSTEGVLSVNASLIIASDRAGPPEVVKTLKSSPIQYIEIAEDFSPLGIAGKARQVSRIVGLEAAGNELASRIEGDFETLAAQRGSIKKPLRALFVLNVANGRATVGGSNTSADAILKLAGAENAAASINGFKPISDEAMVELKPEAIVTMRRSNGNHDAHQILAMKGMSTSPAAVEKRVFSMDGLYLLGFGPRAPAAALDLMRMLYPELPKRAELAR
ncbi:ABC transporter substrate-binding protein [Hyphomicrobium sp. CS1GBMeth3]|uniref:heme/hemin ABC transporter substrate-binding protein n=1 Tax=Hyphomicrobium sp. CS1GBMeth3 TaxID=1892845 RepID=UPI00093004BB|nr:ABC transporter substrate-binding protein [Hyphomicrobium sp. CS1GBMeth3]